MTQYVTLKGIYSRGFRWASTHWQDICAEHKEEFPVVTACYPGTFNLLLDDKAGYAPPGEDEYRRMARERGQAVNTYEDGNHLSPRARVIELNGAAVEAWIYRGGHPADVLELIALAPLAKGLALAKGDAVTVRIVEYSDEDVADMPAPPPAQPGRSALPLAGVSSR